MKTTTFWLENNFESAAFILRFWLQKDDRVMFDTRTLELEQSRHLDVGQPNILVPLGGSLS